MTLLLLASIVLVDRAESAGIRFVNVFGGAEKRFIYETLGSGAALFDFDSDSDLDIYLVNGAERLDSSGPPDRLYRNEGDGTFREVTAESGVGDEAFGVAVAAADIDADGDTDLFVANNGADGLLINQGDGTFHRISFGDDLMAGGAAFGDYDADGLPDLYVSSYVDRSAFLEGGQGLELCNWKGLSVGCGPAGLPASPDRLYRNEGGRFHDVSGSSGIAAVDPSYGLGVLFRDLNGDGRSDIYVANDGRPHFLFINQGGGKFSEEGLMRGAAYSGDGREQAGMGVDAGDIDADGDPDLVVTNFSHDHTTLYENLGTGFFTDASYRRGIGAPTYFPLSWGVQLLDLDSDGDSDLYVAHGHIYPDVERVAPETRYKEPDQVFRNDGNGRFELVEWSAPLGSSRGAAAGDYDGDGRIDLLVTNIDGPPHLLHNETVDGGRALVVELAGLRSSREGLGATVTVQTSARRLSQEAGTSGSHASARDPKLHFGVGRERVLSLEVVWPSGRRDRIEAPESSSIRALPPQPQRFSLPDSLRAPSARAEGSILVIKEGVGLVAARLFERAEAR